MKVINIVSSISKINFGVWNAALFGTDYLKKSHKVDSEMWICNPSTTDFQNIEVPFFYFDKEKKTKAGFEKWISKYNTQDTIIVTHGAWLEPTKLGYWAKKLKYRWIHLPHGMFEPYAFTTKGFQKKVYIKLFEGRYLKKVDLIRAVSDIECENLKKMFPKVERIFNGVKTEGVSFDKKPTDSLNFLFLARLQKKKGIVFLAEAWSRVMSNHPTAKLIIAGPDEGELEKIKPFLSKNIEYVGTVYGVDKVRLLEKAHYYLLPSFSEGFPTSVVEAMSYGAIPIISEGCNFPDVFAQKLGYEVSPDVSSIEIVLREVENKAFDNQLSLRNVNYVQDNLSEEVIGEQLFQLYQRILQEK
ncbi:MAG: glycosyltransferase [Bacteroidales bacterium]|nr:glycosyltransferase [Bacteroidales bacterium]